MSGGITKSMRPRRRWWVVATVLTVAILLAVPVVHIAHFMITQATGRITVATDACGVQRTVYWRHYPGIAGISPQEILDGPSVEDGYATGDAMVAEIRAGLTAESGLKWTENPNQSSNPGPFIERTQNWFGGESMLTVINAPPSQSTSVPASWEDKQRAIGVIAEVAARYGFSAPVLDHERDKLSTDEDRLRDLGGTSPDTQVIVAGMVQGPTGQWMTFTFRDLAKDTDGRMAERLKPATEHGWESNTVVLSYGANGLLHEADKDEFERRLKPFVGLTPPPPLET